MLNFSSFVSSIYKKNYRRDRLFSSFILVKTYKKNEVKLTLIPTFESQILKLKSINQSQHPRGTSAARIPSPPSPLHPFLTLTPLPAPRIETPRSNHQPHSNPDDSHSPNPSLPTPTPRPLRSSTGTIKHHLYPKHSKSPTPTIIRRSRSRTATRFRRILV